MVISPLAHATLQAIDRVAGAYEKLVLVVGPIGTGKTTALHTVSSHLKCPCINVNLALSQLLLDVPRTRWSLQAGDLLGDVLPDQDEAGPVVLDNLELLFEANLHIQPLNWLRRTSRARLVVASWNGHVDRGFLTYAEPGHPGYRRESVEDLTIVAAERRS